MNRREFISTVIKTVAAAMVGVRVVVLMAPEVKPVTITFHKLDLRWKDGTSGRCWISESSGEMIVRRQRKV